MRPEVVLASLAVALGVALCAVLVRLGVALCVTIVRRRNRREVESQHDERERYRENLVAHLEATTARLKQVEENVRRQHSAAVERRERLGRLRLAGGWRR